MIAPNTTIRRREQYRIEDADPMLLEGGLISYERTLWMDEVDERGRVIKTSVYAVYIHIVGGYPCTFFRKPFKEEGLCRKS